MGEVDFDNFAGTYTALHERNIAITGESPGFFSEYKVRDVATDIDGLGGRAAVRRILDFGGGTGNSIAYFKWYFPSAHLVCLDVAQKCLDVARERHGDAAEYVHFDGTIIPFAAAEFDVVFTACTFHHIDHGEHLGILREIKRVLKPGGRFYVFEHNPLNPLTSWAVSTCEFDKDAVLIRAGRMKRALADAGLVPGSPRYRIFFPRALGALRRFERFLTACPLGAQYYIAAERRDQEDGARPEPAVAAVPASRVRGGAQ